MQVATSSTSNAATFSHPVIFTTKTPHVLPPQKYMIPATWRRYQLSELINKVLALPQPVPFDFLVRGEVLRTSLGEWCAERGLGEEETLELEYFESLMPPQRMASMPQEDWVSSVSCQVPGIILAGSYDTTVRLFDASRRPVLTIPGHTAPVTSVCWVGGSAEPGTGTETETWPPRGPDAGRLVASASHDGTARLVRVAGPGDAAGALQPPSAGEAGAGTATALASLQLHTGPVSSVASDRRGAWLLTASWDALVGVWSTVVPEQDEVPISAPGVVEEGEEEGGAVRKRRRVAEDAHLVRKAPEHVMKSHTDRVTRAQFSPLPSSERQAYSCSLDSTLRAWDIELGLCTSTITLSEKPLVDMAVLADGATALAACTDRTVSLHDLRASTVSTGTTSLTTLMHPALPSALVAHRTDARRAMSGAYDGVVRVWDLRSVKAPVASFKGEKGGKVLSVDWGRGVGAFGGEDGVEVWKIGEGAESGDGLHVDSFV